MSIPSLKLAFEKTSTTTLASTNDNSSKNILNLNIVNPGYSEEVLSPRSVTPKDMKSPRRSSIRSYSPLRNAVLSPLPTLVKHPLQNRSLNESPSPRPYNSPNFDSIENEFKSQLLSFTIDILLNDADLIKNIAERGTKVIFHLKQLKQLIAILYLNMEDRSRYEELIETETEPIIIKTCVCKDCASPFFERIKSITINKSVNFLLTPFATNMCSVFRISLEYAI